MNKQASNIAKSVVRNPYAWPGGYPRYVITDDGGALCPNCCKSEFRSIAGSYPGDGWAIIADDINWEDNNLHCDHCNKQIESAYS